MTNSIIIDSINNIIKYNSRYKLDYSLYSELLSKLMNNTILNQNDYDLIIQCLKINSVYYK